MINRKTNSFSISSLWLAGIRIKVGGINLLGFPIPGALGCGLCGLREWRLSQPPAVKKAWRSDWRIRWSPLGTAGWETWWNMMKHVLPSPDTRACKAAGIPARFCILLSSSCRSIPFVAKLRCHAVFSGFWNVGSTDVVSCRSMSFQVPMIAAKDWQEQETLHLVRRNYAAKLWEMIQLSPLDSDPVVFPGDGKWKDWNPWSSLETVPH